MPRIIYPSHFEPVRLPTAVPTVPSFGWFAPFSNPTLRNTIATAIVVSGAVLPPSRAKEVASVDRWLVPLSAPVLQPRALHASLQQAHTEPVSILRETTTVDRWHQPLSQFPGTRPGLHVSQQPAFTWHISTVREATSPDRWFSPLATPVLLPPALRAGLQQAHTEPVSLLRETTTVDRWFSPLSSPVLTPRALTAADQAAFFWHVTTVREAVTVDRWHTPLGLPVWPPRGLHASQQPAFTWHVSIARETVSLDRWHAPLALPVWLRTLPVAARPSFTTSPAFTLPALFVDYVATAEWRAVVAPDTAVPITWPGTAFSDALGAAEQLAGVTADGIVPVEFGASVSSSGAVGAEWRGSAISDASVGAEWRASMLADIAAPTFWTASVDVSSPSLTAWSTATMAASSVPEEFGITIAPSDAAIPVAPGASAFSDGQAYTDWRATVIPPDNVYPLEILPSTMRDDGFQVAGYSLILYDPAIGINWTGPLGVILDAESFIEWRGSPFGDAPTSMEPTATARRDATLLAGLGAQPATDSPSAGDISATSTTDGSSPAAWTAVPVSLVVSGITFETAAITDTTAATASSLTAAREDTSFAETNETVTADRAVLTEWRGALNVTEDVIAGIEFRAGRVVDAGAVTAWVTTGLSDITGNAGWASTITPIDFVFQVASGLTASSVTVAGVVPYSLFILDAIAPMEIGGLIDQVTGDVDAALEFGLTVFFDGSSWADWSFTFPSRFTKGATVEVQDTPVTHVAITEGSGTRGAALETPAAPDSKPIAEGSGTKGAALER